MSRGPSATALRAMCKQLWLEEAPAFRVLDDACRMALYLRKSGELAEAEWKGVALAMSWSFKNGILSRSPDAHSIHTEGGTVELLCKLRQHDWAFVVWRRLASMGIRCPLSNNVRLIKAYTSSVAFPEYEGFEVPEVVPRDVAVKFLQDDLEKKLCHAAMPAELAAQLVVFYSREREHTSAVATWKQHLSGVPVSDIKTLSAIRTSIRALKSAATTRIRH
ncbi:hypothetical protein DIPPA_30861 [Diplonema papillatum]|nr:hypothetical protein DIPPA_30861 [Diplonema papillatum]